MGQITALLLLFLCVHPVHAKDVAYDLSSANKAYQEGSFPQAIDQYEQLRAQGLDHWILYYDLGNAYYKAGQSGKAAANYLRAFRRNPSDRDLVFNLNKVLTEAGDPLLPEGGLAQFLWRLYFGFPIALLAGIVALLATTMAIGGGVSILGMWRQRPAIEIWVLAGVLLFFFGSWFYMRYSASHRLEGVVVLPTAEVRSGPSSTYPTSFTIPAARRVLLLSDQESVKGWLHIGVPKEGLKGWIAQADVDVL